MKKNNPAAAWSVATATDAVIVHRARPELPDPTPEEIAAQVEADKPRED